MVVIGRGIVVGIFICRGIGRVEQVEDPVHIAAFKEGPFVYRSKSVVPYILVGT